MRACNLEHACERACVLVCLRDTHTRRSATVVACTKRGRRIKVHCVLKFHRGRMRTRMHRRVRTCARKPCVRRHESIGQQYQT